jgi:hypothetical protein
MNNEELKNLFLSEMRAGIDNVVLGIQEEYRNDFLSPSDFEGYLRQKGIDTINDVDHDQNGWEMDNWHRYKIDGKKFTISGSGWFGGTSFSLSVQDQSDEDDIEENIENIKPWE